MSEKQTIIQKLFNGFDFKNLNSPDFKEDSVREIIILPILKELGYNSNSIVRNKTLSHPFLKIGSKKRQINIIPDYLMKIDNSYAWVLDAKSPTEEIKTGDHIEQVYSYAIHPEIRTKFFTLCNGREFVIFRTDEQIPILFFDITDIEDNWEKLKNILAIDCFQLGKTVFYYQENQPAENKNFDYLNRPLLDEIEVKKRAAKRHFGVHGYFTKQSWNVVQEYIKHFSRPGDIVLDPFGGSGVTAVEALMTKRKTIHIDINPMSVFIVESLLAPVNNQELVEEFDKIKDIFSKKAPKTEEQIKDAIKRYPHPNGNILPKGSDVDTVSKLFSDKQLAGLAFLKHLILKTKNINIRKSLLLAFSSTITKINLTYHNSTYASKNAGDCAAFRYYRYRLAPEMVDLDVWATYEGKFRNIVRAKKEIEYEINEKTIDNAQIIKGSATDLNFIKSQSIDYIYTDPPYGKKIPYLDLSVMWNSWLDLEVTDEDYKLEAIEGGEHNKSKDEYCELISESIKEMYRVLKFDRWMSFVFAHKDPEFWHLIINIAEKCGFEYAGAVKQSNGQTSFKKRQNPFTVLAGQLIINFKKVAKPRSILKAALGMDISEIIIQTIEGIIAKNHGATLEEINDELIIKGLELGFLDLLKKEYSDLTPLLLESFDYDENTEIFTLKKDAKFKTSIDIKLRIKYYLISFLRRKELEGKLPDFDEIVFNILPLLKNGNTPEHQTILNVLEDIGEKIGEHLWRLKRKGQMSLFN